MTPTLTLPLQGGGNETGELARLVAVGGGEIYKCSSLSICGLKKRMNKKLFYIINHMEWFWSHRLPLAQGAKDAGWEVHVCATGLSKDTRLSLEGFYGADLPESPLALMLKIRKLIKQGQPEIIHAITLKYAFFAGLAVRGTDTKIVHTLAGLGYLFSGEGLKPKILRFILGPLLKIALKGENTQIIFQNPDDMALMKARGFVDPERCHLIKGSGVDTKEFPLTDEPANKPPVVTMPTRLVHEKGVSIFIEAAKILKDKGVEAVFQIAGGEALTNPRGITAKQMETMIGDSGVKWLGKVNEMPELLAKSNLIVYPSYYGEGIPKVLLEAASTGRAIITTDHPGCREAVKDDVNGLLVPIKDAQATADAIEALLNDPDRRAKMGKQSRKMVEDEFSVPLVVLQTLKVYEEI